MLLSQTMRRTQGKAVEQSGIRGDDDERLTPIRWVFVRDLQGTHQEEYFYTTNISLTARQTANPSKTAKVELTAYPVRGYFVDNSLIGKLLV